MTSSPLDTCPTVEDLVASANATLDATPDLEYFHKSDREVVGFTFPDWEVRVVVDGMENRRRILTPRALLQHRTQPQWWLFIGSNSIRLLPGRGSTMGQFFRYRVALDKNFFAVGTPIEVVEMLKGRTHPDAWGHLPLWTVETFAGLGVLSEPIAQEWAALRERVDGLEFLRAMRRTEPVTD